MACLYWFVANMVRHETGIEIPDYVDSILDNEHGGLSFTVYPDGIIKGVIVTKELVDSDWLKEMLDLDLVEFVKEEQLGPGSVIVDREGLRLQLAE